MSDVSLIFPDDDEIREEPVRIKGVDYILIECSEEDATRWRNHAIRAAKMKSGKVSAMGDIAEMEPILVSYCLHTKDKRQPVPLSTILQWPSRYVKPIFERAKVISGLNEKLTAAQIRERIAELQEELEEMEAEDPTTPTSVTGTSSSSPSSGAES